MALINQVSLGNKFSEIQTLISDNLLIIITVSLLKTIMLMIGWNKLAALPHAFPQSHQIKLISEWNQQSIQCRYWMDCLIELLKF